MKGDVAAALKELREQYDIGADPLGGAGRPRRVHPFRHPHQDRAGGGRRHLARRGRAHARPRARRRAVDARAVAHLADAAQGHRARCRRRPAARRRRDGAGAHRLRRRSADAGRGDPLARRRRRAARPQGNGNGGGGERQRRRAARCPPRRASAPRYDAPRGGGPRAMARASRAGMQQPRRSRRARRRWRSTVSPSWWRWRASKRDIQIKLALERDVRLVRCEDGTARDRARAGRRRRRWSTICRASSQQWTGRRWMVVVSREPGAADAEIAGRARARPSSRRGVRADPLVKAVLERFPGAEIVGVRGRRGCSRRSRRRCRRAGRSPLPDDIGFGDNWERDDGVSDGRISWA